MRRIGDRPMSSAERQARRMSKLRQLEAENHQLRVRVAELEELVAHQVVQRLRGVPLAGQAEQQADQPDQQGPGGDAGEQDEQGRAIPHHFR